MVIVLRKWGDIFVSLKTSLMFNFVRRTKTWENAATHISFMCGHQNTIINIPSRFKLCLLGPPFVLSFSSGFYSM